MKESDKIKYIALLRGINVGGHNVKMEKLRELFNELDFDDARSFIQSGNIFFNSTENDVQLLRDKIEQHLQATLGYKVPVCLRTKEELEYILSLDPFKDIEVTPDIRFAVTFLTEPAKENVNLPYITPDGAYELVAKTPMELFVVWHLKNGRPGNSYGLLEKMLHVDTTTRFWHTTAKILDALKKG